jgi:hypothetical protein
MALARALLALLFAITSSGCATLFSGEKQDVKVRAYPQDAVVTVDGRQNVSANATVPLSRSEQHFIDVQKDGFQAKRVQVKQTINPWFFANLALLPFFWVGMLVDAVSGKINELEPTDITVNLETADPNRPQVAQSAPSSSSSSSGFNVNLGGPSLDPTVQSSGTAKQQKSSGVVTQTKPAGPAIEQPNMKPAGPAPSSTTQPADAAGKTGDARPKIPKTSISAAQRDWVIAVMTTDATGKTGFDKGVLLALTDQIRVFLAERGAKVIDRGTQDAALKGFVDEEKKKSYSSCVDSSCQIPLGKALAASHILRSTVAKFGKACATNGELIDLRAEVTVAAGSARSECSEEDLLYAAESLAEQLIAGSAKSK